jgi:hypothetical protein
VFYTRRTTIALIAEVTNPCVATVTAEIAGKPDMRARSAPVRLAAVSG